MKQPIAMRCTKKQFKAIEPKLKEIGEIGNLVGAFEAYKYLTNNYNQEQYVFDFVDDGKLFEKEHQNNIHEEWNEKIFLEACGIEVEKKFSITESQIKTLEADGINYVKEWFPEVFKIELEVGKWYKSMDNVLVFLNEFNSWNNYGFNNCELWTDKYEVSVPEKWKEATEQEVFEALKNEAVKRGYKDGTWLKKSGINKINDQELKICGEFEYYPFSNILYCQEGNGYIFEKGQWAEIIETITLSEAEQQLKKKIIVNK